MAQFNADILLNVSTNQRSLDRVAATVGRINSLAKQVKPINLFAPGAGAGADQVRTSMEVILKRAQAINKIGSAQISATYAGAAQTADAFAEVLRNVNIQAKNGNVALEQQDNRVQNLAGAYAQAAAKADLLSDRYAEIIRQARQAQGLAIGPISTLGTVESDSAAAESRAQAVAQQQASKNLRSDVLYQRLRLQLLQKQSSELLEQDSILAKLAQKAAKLGGAGKLGESLSLGVGFPLLFGAGPGSILGSAVGSFFGKGFGGQILGGGIGQVLDQAVIRVRDIGNAINQLSFDKLRESGVKVTSQLEEQLTFLKQIGRAEEARLQLSERVAQQTGTFAGTTEDIANATNILGDAWSKLTLSASTTLGIIGAPFVAALGAVLEVVNKIFQGLNFIGSAIGTAIKKAGEFVVELFGGEDALTGIENKLNNIDDQLGGLTRKAANLINTLSTKLSTTEIDLGVAQGLRLGDTADDKTANVRLKEQADLDKLRLSYINEQRELALQLDELGKTGYNKSLQLLKNDYERNKQLIKQQATNESIKISNQENERLTRESAQNRKKEAQELLKIATLQAQLNTSTALLGIDKQIATATVDGDKTKLAELEYTKALEASELKIAEIRARGLSEAQTKIQIKLEENRLESELLGIDTKRALERQKLEESFRTTVDGLTIELGLAKATTRAERERLDIEKERLALRNNKDLTDGQKNEILQLKTALQEAQAPLAQYFTQTQLWINDTESQIVSLAQSLETSISGAMAGAVEGIITGSKTVQEVMSEMFAQIGRAFLNMAAEIIAKQLVMIALQGILKALGAVSGGGGGGFQGDSLSQFNASAAQYKFAEGGYVTGPTNALIGEAGESEYVIPSSKMGAAMANYRAGKRGGSVVSDAAGGYEAQNGGNNTFTLETVVINSVEYATVAQVREMGKAAAKQGAQGGYTKTLGSLRNSRATRARIGMG